MYKTKTTVSWDSARQIGRERPIGRKSTILWLEIHGKFAQWNNPFKPTFPFSPALSIPFWNYIGYLLSLVWFTLPFSNPCLSLSPFRPSLPFIPPQLTTIPHHFFLSSIFLFNHQNKLHLILPLVFIFPVLIRTSASYEPQIIFVPYRKLSLWSSFFHYIPRLQ